MAGIEIIYADGDVVDCGGKPGDVVLDAIRHKKAEFVYDCMEGTCKTCVAQLSRGTVRQQDGQVLDARQTPEILCCQCVLVDPGVSLSVKYRRVDVLPVRDRKLVIVSITRLSNQCIRLVLESQGALRFLPGQYLRLNVPGTSQTRAYSIANSPGGKRIELLISRIEGGVMTRYLEGTAKVGDSITGRGPMGSFVLRAAAQPRLFIAGGTGLAPVYSMLQQLALASDMAPIRLAFGVNRAADVFFTNELEQLRAELPDFDYVVCAMDSEDPLILKRGSALAAVSADWLDLVARHGAAYLCGPPGMVDAATRVLQDAGMSTDRIFFEEFTPSCRTNPVN